MILKTGIDIIEIPRIQAALDRHGERFLKRIFTAKEIIECNGQADALAVRFAAKEAASKALGTGIGPVSWREIETLHKWSRRTRCQNSWAGHLGGQPESQPG